MFATDKVIGKEIDGYHILDVLGRGGMGIVYKAEDVALSRTVALKMIDPMLAHDEAFLRRFRSEAQALARIQSPYIVGVYALRRTEVGSFIVMEYVDGGTIYDLRTPYPWQKALPIIKQMVTALDHAHSVGVIHRDIKPRNIMLTASGVVKVADFGLAKLRQDDRTATVTQGIAGTLFYMSPEQVKNLSTLDHRSDLYSMGMTMYELLAGRLPFDKEASEFTTMRRIVEDRFEPPDRFNTDIPASLTKVVLKALEKDPEDRFQSAAEMLSALEAIEVAQAAARVEDATVPLRVTQGWSGGGREKQRYSPWPALLVAVGIVIVAAIGYVIYGWVSGAPAESEVVAAHGAATELGEGTVPEQESTAERDQIDDTGSVPAGSVDAGGTELVSDEPGPDALPEPPVAYGTVAVRAEGSGPVMLNGQAVTPGSSHQVRAGVAQRIACGEAPLVAAKTVTLSANRTEEVTCYFQGTVSVVTHAEDGETLWGAIWINGDNTGKYTPMELDLPSGRYEITARRDGYTAREVRTIEVAPSFERQVIPVVITLKKDAAY